MSKVLILVASQTNLPFILAAKNLGFYVITCDNNVSNPGHKFADENLFIDVYNYEAIIKAVKDKNIDGVMSFVSAHGLNSASLISEHYNLKGYSKITLETLTNKGLFRDFLSVCNLNFPIYQCVDNINKIDFGRLTYPLIIKPTDKGGSQGVIKINNEKELFLNFEKSKNLSDIGTVIIEEFLEGEALINGDCIIHNGEIIGNIIGDYIYDNDTNNVIPISTVFPSNHDVSEALKQISVIVKALEIPNGIINFEAIIKKNIPYIVEINPRPSGNYIWKLLGFKYNIDVASFLFNLYFNSDICNNKLEESNTFSYAYQLIYSNKNKIFKGFTIPTKLKGNILDINIIIQKNEYIFSLNNLFDKVGIILLEFRNDKERKLYIENTNIFRI